MKKTAKFLVAVGSVATLGLAALPLSNISAAQTSARTSGNVDLYVEVKAAISMTISGTHDDDELCGVVNKYADAGGNTAGVVDTFVGTPGGANEVNNNTSCSKITMLPNSFDETSSRVKVYTNNAMGYELSVSAAESTDLTHMGDRQYTIPAGTLADETGGQGVWSYKTDGGIVSEWSKMKANDTLIRTRNEKTYGGEETNITYGVSATSDQASGMYKTTLVYTATTLDGGEEHSPFDSCGTASGSTCEVSGVTYKRLADGKLWSTSAAGGSSNRVANLSCPANTHLPTGADFYDLLMEYGAETTTGNEWPYGIALQGEAVSNFRNETGWTSGQFFASSSLSDGDHWGLAFFGNSYVGIDKIPDGMLPSNGVCVAD